jgi:hypothetical protein
MKDSQAHVNMKMIIDMSIIKFQIMTLFTQLYVRVCILFTFGKSIYEGIISIKRFKAKMYQSPKETGRVHMC